MFDFEGERDIETREKKMVLLDKAPEPPLRALSPFHCEQFKDNRC